MLRFSLSDNGDRTCEISVGSSSEIAYPSIEGSGVRGNVWHWEDDEPLEEYEGSDRIDPIDPLLRVVPNIQVVADGELALAVLELASIELRPDRYDDPVE